MEVCVIKKEKRKEGRILHKEWKFVSLRVFKKLEKNNRTRFQNCITVKNNMYLWKRNEAH